MSQKKKIKRNFFEILMYIIGFFYITSFIGLFFLSTDWFSIKILAIVFTISCILAIIVATILEKKEKKYTEKEIQKNIERALNIRDD